MARQDARGLECARARRARGPWAITRRRHLATGLAGILVALLSGPGTAIAAVPSGFQETTVLGGLVNPTVVQFAADGRIFVAEKSGIIKVFDGFSDSSPDTFADLRTRVHNFWDRGLLGMALAPTFPSDPSVYVLYTYDHVLGEGALPPKWGTPGATNDNCPSPPGATADGCVVSGRLSKLTASGGGNVSTGTEQVLIEDWCQQYPSHSIGALAFGPSGALYVSAGDGASFNFADYGQDGSPLNPCGDPPTGQGTALTPPTAEGGALRSQDVRTSGDPLGLDGTILRIDPATGAGWPGNPMAGDSNANARRLIATGLRNPFRIAVRPGTEEVWIGDVGWSTWEEIDRIADPGGSLENFGWPCYEGTGRQPSYDNLNVTLCENLYAAGSGAVSAPSYSYRHSDQVVSGESCSNGQGSSTAGLAFYQGGSYPDAYDGALFFADYSRDCIWVMFPGTNGVPDPATRQNFVTSAANPVDLKIGPAGDLFYVDFNGGTIRRITYTSGNLAPVARATANPTSGVAPLTVSFDGTGSSDPEGGALTYAWDLDGDGAYDDAAVAAPTWTYQTAGSFQVRLRVTDPEGASGVSAPITITAGNSAPTAVIDTPLSTTTWAVGQTVTFSGHATDPQDGALPASALRWDLVLLHCPSSCHEHPITTFAGVASGSFVAPDHEYPTKLLLRLTATDPGGLSHATERVIDPRTVVIRLVSDPAGLELGAGGTVAVAPFDHVAIEGSTVAVVAPTPQTLGGIEYGFRSWSDGGAASHAVVATTNRTLTATYGATADLRVTQTAAVTTGRVVFTVSVHNNGPSGVTAAVLTDTLPDKVTFDASRSTTGCSASGRVVTCQLGAIGNATTRTVTIAATTGKAKGFVDNVVTVRSELVDPVSADNSSTVRVRLK